MALPNADLEQAGLELILKGQRDFEAGLQRVEKAIQGFNNQTANTERESTRAASAMGTLSVGTIALGAALGSLAAGAIRDIAGGFRDATVAAFEMSAAFERTQISFSSMLGSVEIAGGLLRDLSEFAKKTPFTIPEIEKLSQQFIGMGFAAGEVIPNMRMLFDVSAGVNANLDRVAFNYGQIRSQNKAYTLDLRQFAMAGIPIYEELAKVLDVSVGEIRQLTEEGKIGFREVQQAFENMTSEGGRFNNLAEQISNTTSGMLVQIRNEAIQLARSFGGPLLDSAKEVLGVILSFIRELGPGGSLSRVVTAFGATISVVFDSIASLGKGASDALAQSGDEISNRFLSWASEALEWGIQLVGNFALGMIRGASMALTAALNFIGSIISYWLAPGSPPNLLPNIDNWGMSAFEEYLRGFTKADFGILTTLQAPIKRALDLIQRSVKLTLDPKKDKSAINELAIETAKLYGKLSKDVAQAISEAQKFGTVNQQVIDRVRQSTGQFGNDIARLLELELKLAAATGKVAQANEMVIAAQREREEFQRILEGEQDELSKARDEVNRLQEQLFTLHKFDIGGEITIQTAVDLQAAQKHLKTVEGRVDAAEEAVDLAKVEEDNARVLLEIERDKQQLIAEQVAVQNDLLNQLLSMADVQLNPFEKALDTLDKVGDAMKDIAEKFEFPQMDITPLSASLDTAFDEMKTKISARFAEILAPLREEWNKIFAGTGLESPLESDNLAEQNEIRRMGGEPARTPGPVANLIKAFEDVRTAIDEVVQSSSYQALFGEGGLLADGKLALIIGGLAGALVVLAGAWAILSSPIVAVGLAIGAVWALFEKAEQIGKDLGRAIGLLIVQFFDPIKKNFDDMQLAWEDFKRDFNRFLNEFVNLITGKKSAFIDAGKDLINGLWDGLKATWDLVTTWWRQDINLLKSIWQTITGSNSPSRVFNQLGQDLLQGLWNGLKSKWNALKIWWEGIVESLADIWAKITGSNSPSKVFMQFGDDIMEGLQRGLSANAFKPLEEILSLNREMSASSALLSSGAGGTVQNVTNYNINANYSELQSPSRIADDLSLLSALTG